MGAKTPLPSGPQHHYTFSMPADIWTQLRDRAEQEGRTVAATLRQAIRLYLEGGDQ